MNNSSYTTQNDLLLKNLMSFYRTDLDGAFNPNNNLDKMLRIITGESKISLRIVDWFATNYAKKYYTLYTIEQTVDNVARRFKVYDDYKLKLINVFETFVKTYYDESYLSDIQMITNSLLFTLIPLHNNSKCILYYDLINLVNRS
jgi:hypothetical protein